MKKLLLYLTLTFLLVQSCVIYKNDPSSIATAVNNGQVKIGYPAGNNNIKYIKYRDIKFEYKKYYGYLKRDQGKRINDYVPIDKNKVRQVYLKDKTASTAATILISTLSVGIGTLLVLFIIYPPVSGF